MARVVLIVVAMLTCSGCVAIKSESASQRLPGFVTLRLDICVSDHDRSTYATCDPDRPGGNTAEPDDGSDGDEIEGARGQLLVGYRVPLGTVAPAGFTTADGSASFARSATYTNALSASFPPPAGFRWEGYLSTDAPLDPANPDDRQTTLQPEFALPQGADGAPFAGPLRWRAIVGFRFTGSGGASPSDPVRCNDGATSCFDSPSAGVADHLSKNVSDLGVLSGGAVTVAAGDPASLTFPIRNLDAGSLGARTVAVSATTTVPSGTATLSAPSVAVPANGVASAGVSIAVPASTTPGTYDVAVTALATSTAPGPPLSRTNHATITVVDRRAPAIRLGTPSNGATFNVGQRVSADYACTDEPGGTGVRTCAAPVPPGAPIDTSSPGAKTFTVSTADVAGNRASSTATYNVVRRPAGRVSFTVAFDFGRTRTRTTFTRLRVGGAPPGATITVTCRGSSCPTRKVKGKHRAIRLTKKATSKPMSLTPWLQRPLRVGTTLTITATRPDSFGKVKQIRVRAGRGPQITTTCLRPDSKTRTRCAG